MRVLPLVFSFHHRMHDAVPKLVAIAVRMVITTCTTVFHVSLFILVYFNFSPLTSHLSKECPLRGNSVDSLSVIRTCRVRSTGATTALRWVVSVLGILHLAGGCRHTLHLLACADRPNQKWATDVTQVCINDRKLYLSPILDMFDGGIISYTISTSPNICCKKTYCYCSPDTVAHMNRNSTDRIINMYNVVTEPYTEYNYQT